MTPASKKAYNLLHEGTLAMSRIEQAGLRIDVDYLDKSIKRVKKLIIQQEEELRTFQEWKEWEKNFGGRMVINNPSQLGKVVFDIMGNKRNPHIRKNKKSRQEDSETGEEANHELAFEHLDIPFVKMFFRYKKLKNALAKNLLGIKKEVCNGYIHPFFDLHSVESYRSASNKPNFQNTPTRDKIISEIVRSCVIPRKDHVLLEIDYSTQEVRVAYCYNKDEKLKYDILTGDMHRDRSMELYMLTSEQMTKDIRYCGKNKFVFPQFYGSYYAQCAPNLWDAISQMNLKLPNGVSLFEHLHEKGITKLGDCDPNIDPDEDSFEYHVRAVEQRMWKEVYTTYDQWKRDWWAKYQRRGWFKTKTGFVLHGDFRRNQVLCDPIQGSAFHCLLWSIIQMQKEMLVKKMKSLIVCQIHDSALIDAHKKEVSGIIEMAKRIMTVDVAEYYKWITVPLGIEFEICETNWFQKKALAA